MPPSLPSGCVHVALLLDILRRPIKSVQVPTWCCTMIQQGHACPWLEPSTMLKTLPNHMAQCASLHVPDCLIQQTHQRVQDSVHRHALRRWYQNQSHTMLDCQVKYPNLPGGCWGSSAGFPMAARPIASRSCSEAAEDDAQASPKGSVEALLGRRTTRLLIGMLLRSSFGTPAEMQAHVRQMTFMQPSCASGKKQSCNTQA